MEMIIKGITAHTIDGCTSAEDVIGYFDKHPQRYFVIEGQAASYRDFEGHDDYYVAQYTNIFETNVYKIVGADLHISNIDKIYVVVIDDCEFSVIETKVGQVHIVNDRDFAVDEGGICWVVLRASGVDIRSIYLR